MRITSGTKTNSSILTTFAQNTYEKFSKLSPEELGQDRLLGKVITERVELKSLIREGGLVIQAQSLRKSPKMFEVDVFPALSKYQAMELYGNGQEKLFGELLTLIETNAEYAMSLTGLLCDEFGYQYSEYIQCA